jgi:NAD(P)-dependent dehydrogenase (short-subunit alcohol dehydrogenase family)
MSVDGILRDGLSIGDHVIITGAGGGFGRAFCQRLAKSGAKISAWDIDEERGNETARLVREAGGVARFFRVDLSDSADIDATIAATLKTYGAPYGLINNASIYPRGSVLDLSVPTFEKTLKVNITAPYHLIHAFSAAMISAQRGIIINIASGRALEGAVNGANYACSKAAILNLTKTVALEFARHNVRCNTIIPGVSFTAQPLENTTPEELIARGKSRIPLGRIGYPEDIAGLAAFLMSPDASYMTGQAVAMNGGMILVS